MKEIKDMNREETVKRMLQVRDYLDVQDYHLSMDKRRPLEDEYKVLEAHLKTLPLQEQIRCTYGLYTQPPTLMSKDRDVTLQFKKGTWNIAKFTPLNYKGGMTENFRVTTTEDGRPKDIRYELISSETNGQWLTIVHPLNVDKPEPIVHYKPQPSIEIPTWHCVQCGTENYEGKLFCIRCNKAHDEQVSKDFTLGQPEPEKKDSKLGDKIKGLFK